MNIGSQYSYSSDDQSEFLVVVSRDFESPANASTMQTAKEKVPPFRDSAREPSLRGRVSQKGSGYSTHALKKSSVKNRRIHLLCFNCATKK